MFRFTAPRLQPVPLALVPVLSVTNAEPLDRISVSSSEDLFYTHPVSGLFGSLDDASASAANAVSLERAESEIMYAGATTVRRVMPDEEEDDDAASWVSSTLSSASLASKERCVEATNPVVLRNSIVVLDVDTSTSVI